MNSNTKAETGDQPESFIELKFLIPKVRDSINFQLITEAIIGSNKGCDVFIDDNDISDRHARIFVSEFFDVFIEPVADSAISLNGSIVKEPVMITNGDWVVLGAKTFQLAIDNPHLATRDLSTISNDKTTKVDLRAKSKVTIGRSNQCDLVISSPLVSREHARLIKDPSGWVIQDNNSTNGTFVNTQRIQNKLKLEPFDSVAIATYEYIFSGTGLEASKQTGKVQIEVRDLTKTVKDRNTSQAKNLLQDINFTIKPGEFVGVFGTSGSGKSTLLDALNGRRPATSGQILYNNIDLYSAFDLFRTAIGYVPQQDIVHRNIMVQHALEYTAKLRLPPDTSAGEMGENTQEVLKKVGLAEKARLLVNTPAPLSGGQLKRVSLAIELVASPNILFLDEVTSGLDAGTDKKMMTLFRQLADDNKTVICITHTLENIENCHLVVLLHQGRLVYFGPPQAVVDYFGMERLSDVYDVLESKPVEFWADKFLVSDFHQIYVEQRSSSLGQNVTQQFKSQPFSAHRKKIFDIRQTFTLMNRYVELLMSDKRNMLFLILQAPLVALIIGNVFTMENDLAAQAAIEKQIVFILSLSVIWFGCINAVRELVKELPIYLRERSVNLGIVPYLASKLFPLSVICFTQCLLLLAVLEYFIQIPGNLVLRFLVLFAISMSATLMGLAVSAFVNSNDKAMTAIPMLLVPQIILSGAVVKLKGAASMVAKATMVSYWGYEAMKSTLDENVKSVKNAINGEFIVTTDYSLTIALSAVIGLSILFLIIALTGLKLKDKAV